MVIDAPITDFTLVFKLVPIGDSIKATQTQVKSKARSLLSLHLQTINPESGVVTINSNTFNSHGISLLICSERNCNIYIVHDIFLIIVE